LDSAASIRHSCRLEFSFGLVALVFLSALTGCGGVTPVHCRLEACAPNPTEVFYVGSGGPLQTSGQIEAFPIDTSNGSLGHTSVIAGPLGGMAATSNSAFLYVSDSVNNQILGYAINATDGGLTPIQGSPFACGTSNQRGGGLVIDPKNKFLYATDVAAATITGFTIDGSTGVLKALSSSFNTGFAPGRMMIDPADKFLEVADIGTGLGGISSFALDSSTGMLTPGASGALTFVTNAGAADIALHPSGNFLFLFQGSTAANSGVMEFTVDRTNGFPTPVGSGPAPTGLAPEVMTEDQAGKFLYVGNGGDATITGFSIDGSTGELQELAKSPYALGLTPPPAGAKILLNLVIDPTAQFVYVTNSENKNISVFRISSTGDLTPASMATLNSTGPGPMIAVKLP
jgi:6-phosphogluconolactonase